LPPPVIADRYRHFHDALRGAAESRTIAALGSEGVPSGASFQLAFNKFHAPRP